MADSDAKLIWFDVRFGRTGVGIWMMAAFIGLTVCTVLFFIYVLLAFDFMGRVDAYVMVVFATVFTAGLAYFGIRFLLLVKSTPQQIRKLDDELLVKCFLSSDRSLRIEDIRRVYWDPPAGKIPFYSPYSQTHSNLVADMGLDSEQLIFNGEIVPYTCLVDFLQESGIDIDSD